jgi:hypothetical protein
MVNCKTFMRVLKRTHVVLEPSFVDGHDLFAERHARNAEKTASDNRMGRDIHAPQIGSKGDDADEGTVLIGGIIGYHNNRAHSTLYVAFRESREICKPDIVLADSLVGLTSFHVFSSIILRQIAAN